MDIGLYKKYEKVITNFLKYKDGKIYLINDTFYTNTLRKNAFGNGFVNNSDTLMAITNLSPCILLNEINEVVVIFDKKMNNNSDLENNKLFSELEFKKFNTINGRELLLELKLNNVNNLSVALNKHFNLLKEENKRLKDQLTIVID